MDFYEKTKNISLSVKGNSNKTNVVFVDEAKFKQSSEAPYQAEMIDKDGYIASLPIGNELASWLAEAALMIPDVSQAVKNAKNTANTKYMLEIKYTNKNLSDEQKGKIYDRAVDELKELAERVYGPSNLHGFINDSIASSYQYGATCVEWVPYPDMSGIERVVIIPANTFRWKVSRSNRLSPYQKVTNPLNVFDNKKKVKGYIKLNKRTVVYKALETNDGGIYGLPPFLSAVKAIQTQVDSTNSIMSVLKNQALLGWITLLWKKPQRERGESEQHYRERLERYLLDNKDKYKDAFKDGMAVGYQNDLEATHTDIAGNGSGVSDIFQINEEQLFSGLNQDPALAGRTYSTTETYAGVVYDKYLNGMQSVQKNMADILSVGFTLHLQMKGLPIDKVWVKFQKARSLTNKTDAEADFMNQKVNRGLYSDGIVDQQQYANAMGYDKPSMPEPRYPYETDIEAQNEVDNGLEKKENPDGERQTRGDKEIGVTKEEPKKRR